MPPPHIFAAFIFRFHYYAATIAAIIFADISLFSHFAS